MFNLYHINDVFSQLQYSTNLFVINNRELVNILISNGFVGHKLNISLDKIENIWAFDITKGLIDYLAYIKETTPQFN